MGQVVIQPPVDPTFLLMGMPLFGNNLFAVTFQCSGQGRALGVRAIYE